MNTEESIKDINRLTEIMQEAKEIIARLDDKAEGRAYGEYENIPLTEIACTEQNTLTRFCNICVKLGVNTVAQLLRTPSWRVASQRNIGKGSVEKIKKCLMEQYGVEWV